jgi:hypothetical protein
MSTAGENIKFEDPFYWVVGNPASDEKKGPYCAKCYDNGQKLVSLDNPYKGSRYVCPECKSQYFDIVDEDEKAYYCFCSGE